MSTVLIAEADRDLRDAYVRFLAGLGFEVDTATDGLECLSKLRRILPDGLILDLELLWGGGEGVLAILREDNHLLYKQVVLTSAAASGHVLNSLAFSFGVRALTKPFPLSELLESSAIVPSGEKISQPNWVRRQGVLVVDDEPSIRMLLETHLQNNGYSVWTASNGEEALDFCCAHREEIAVVLLDVRMPGLDGPSTFDGIQALDVDIPVCFMTGDPGDYDPRDLLNRGARHLFQKPFQIDEIVHVVGSLTGKPPRQLQEN